MKILMDIILKAFTVKVAQWPLSEEGLKVLMPNDFVAESVCMNPAMASVLQLIHDLLHDIDLAQNLLCEAKILHPNSLGVDCRMLAKISSTANYKKLLHQKQCAIAAANKDRECERQAGLLMNWLPNAEQALFSASSTAVANLKVVLEHVNLIAELRRRCTELPLQQESAHATIRDQGFSLCQRALDVLPTFLCEGLCC